MVPDYVSVLHGAEVGYSVADAVVDGSADRFGKTAVVEWGRVDAEFHARVEDELVNLV